ncbi:hypothetical protein BGX21_001479 [Mortierella sp. AD011]|nr:hypothetical protein BGX21_001479 [Mortierella sp. AD011]
MARPDKDYCCCCIPLRFAVAIIGLVALVLGALDLWSVLRAGSSANTSSRISVYIAAGVYGVLGISGLLSAIIKTYGLAKNFSVLWWTFTIVVSILSIVSLVLVATQDKDELRAVCRDNLLSDKYSAGGYDPNSLEDDVNSCYNLTLIISGVSLAVQVLVMSLCGWVASRYTGEVKHMHDKEYIQPLQFQPQEGYYKA